ncbi:7532_t:CDS:2 [Cetraspora pellucida]|uniref:7532_t:CDS:1 n=1 Tax=Cetraspora pellucida TaxID=1433469 RepID=A0A9N9FYV9_9GLOM|nr:7532_t:CDS:2 [Cetraspora pellucida]
MLIWNDYCESKEDGHRHFRSNLLLFFVEMELLNSVLNEIIFAEMNNFDLKYESEENEIEISNPTPNSITMTLQDFVDLSDLIFGINNSQEEPILTSKEKINMEFESSSLVQDILNDSDLNE